MDSKPLNCYLLYYGKGEIFNKQIVYSLLTLLRIYKEGLPENYRVVVYTDQPETFTSLKTLLQIQTIVINNEMVDCWSGAATKFFLRSKICVIHDFCSKYCGKFLFLDTDTVFTKKLDKIFKVLNSGSSFLHKKEARISAKAYKGYMDLFIGRKYQFQDSGRKIQIDPNDYMWNSGVIGLCSTNADLVRDILFLCDEFTKEAGYYLNEQFSFSLVLAKNTKVYQAKGTIFHYWPLDLKEEVNSHLSALLESFEDETLFSLMKKVRKNKVLRISLLDKLLFNIKPKNIRNFIKYKVPEIIEAKV